MVSFVSAVVFMPFRVSGTFLCPLDAEMNCERQRPNSGSPPLSVAQLQMELVSVKTGSSQSGTDERGKCDSVGLSAACLSNEAMIRSVMVAVA